MSAVFFYTGPLPGTGIVSAEFFIPSEGLGLFYELAVSVTQVILIGIFIDCFVRHCLCAHVVIRCLVVVINYAVKPFFYPRKVVFGYPYIAKALVVILPEKPAYVAIIKKNVQPASCIRIIRISRVNCARPTGEILRVYFSHKNRLSAKNIVKCRKCQVVKKVVVIFGPVVNLDYIYVVIIRIIGVVYAVHKSFPVSPIRQLL